MKGKAVRRLQDTLARYPRLKEWLESGDCPVSERGYKTLTNYLKTQDHRVLAKRWSGSEGTVRNLFADAMQVLNSDRCSRAYKLWETKDRVNSLIPGTHEEYQPYHLIAKVSSDWLMSFLKEMDHLPSGPSLVSLPVSGGTDHIPEQFSTILLVVEDKIEG